MEIWKELNNSNRFDNKFLTVIAEEIRGLIDKDYYSRSAQVDRQNNSLKDVLLRNKEYYPIITEIKFYYPSLGKINLDYNNQQEILSTMETKICYLAKIMHVIIVIFHMIYYSPHVFHSILPLGHVLIVMV